MLFPHLKYFLPISTRCPGVISARTSFSIDSFPDMDPEAMEHFYVQKVGMPFRRHASRSVAEADSVPVIYNKSGPSHAADTLPSCCFNHENVKTASVVGCSVEVLIHVNGAIPRCHGWPPLAARYKYIGGCVSHAKYILGVAPETSHNLSCRGTFCDLSSLFFNLSADV